MNYFPFQVLLYEVSLFWTMTLVQQSYRLATRVVVLDFLSKCGEVD